VHRHPTAREDPALDMFEQEMVSRSELVAALDEISAQKTAALEVEAELIELEGRWLRTENLLIEVMGCTAALNGKIGCIVVQFRQEQVAIKRNAAEAISKLNHEALLRENEMAEYQRLQVSIPFTHAASKIQKH
jgi:hypothetical protein